MDELNAKLESAVVAGDVAKTAVLLAEGGDVNMYDGYLLIASLEHGKELMELLINSGADASGNDSEALRAACDLGFGVAVDVLIAHGADVNAGDGECLGAAINVGNLSIVRALISAGADVNADNSPLALASECGYLDVVATLIRSGASIHAKDGYALATAVGAGHVNIVQYLLNISQDPKHGRFSEHAIECAIDIAREDDLNDIVKILGEYGHGLLH